MPRILLAVDTFAGRLGDAMLDDSCRYCGGAGHVARGLVAVAVDRLEQRIERCPKCNPERPRGIPLTRLSDTFESFNLELNPGMASALARCKKVASGAERFALMHGTYGTGKTHLAIATLNAMGRGAFWKVPDLLDYVRGRAFGDGGIGETEALAPYRDDSGLLVLDDLGVQKDTEWGAMALYRILDARYDLGLPTIITTNVPVSRMDGRIFDRFASSAVNCDGASMRRRR